MANCLDTPLTAAPILAPTSGHDLVTIRASLLTLTSRVSSVKQLAGCGLARRGQMTNTEIVTLAVAGVILLVSIGFLLAAVGFNRKAERIAAMYGYGLVTVRMQDDDLSRLIVKVAQTIANHDSAATYCVQLAQASENANDRLMRHFVGEIKKAMGIQHWFLVYDRDTAEKLSTDLWHTTKNKGKVVK